MFLLIKSFKMTNKKRGYIDITVDGKKKTLHFSMNFWAEFTEQMGVSLQEIGTVFTDKITGKTILSFLLTNNATTLNPAIWIYRM